MVISIAFCDFALWNFASKNETFSATEQNQTYNHSFFFRRLSRIQQEDTPSGQSPFFSNKSTNLID